MNATQPSLAFTTTTGNSSVLSPSPLTSAAGTLPSGSSRNTPPYQAPPVASRAMRPAPASFTPATTTEPSSGGVMGARTTRPSAEKSRTSRSFGAPVVVVIKPGTPGSTPESRMPMMTPRPS